MAKEIRARYSNGRLEPLERLELREGQVVTISISEQPKGKGMIPALRATAGGWEGLVDAQELKRNIYADRLVGTRPEPTL